MRQSRVIGVTGGIGAGKSTVCRWLAGEYSLGLVEADQTGAELMEPGKTVYEALLRRYGEGILQEDGTIDKKALSKLAFRDGSAQREINALEHPLIRDELLRRIRGSRYGTVLLEAALLKEGGLLSVCDEVWYIHADSDTRVERLMKNRGYSREKCEAILALQLQEDEFSELSCLTIENGRDFEETKKALAAEMRRLGVRRRRKE